MKPRATTHNPIEQYVFFAAGCAFCALLATYMYLLSLSVVHVVMNQENEERMHEIAGEIARLEATYMEKQAAIGSEVVEQKGYIAAANKIFIDKDQTSVVTKR